MMKYFYFFLILLAYFSNNNAIYIIYRTNDYVGRPLILNEYIERGLIEEGQIRALIRHPDFNAVESYSGLFTVDERYDTNYFFWFFVSHSNPSEDPLLIWLDGGPGSSSTGALFNYHGPFYITKNRTIRQREYTLVRNHNVIYLDSPAGTGFSHTQSTKGFARNEDDIDRGIVTFLTFFFQLFPKFRRNDFYVIGDSYSGKYCVTLPLAIQRYNRNVDENLRINIKGAAFGNGLINPKIQTQSADFLYHIGILDADQRDELNYIENNRIPPPNETIDAPKIAMLEKLGYAGYFDNFLKMNRPADQLYFLDYIRMPHIRRAIHAGNLGFEAINKTVRRYVNDVNKAETEALQQVLNNFKVLIYNGQLDLFAPYYSSEKYYRTLNWSKAEEYRRAERKLYMVGNELAGFWRTAGDMQEVLLRNAGHVASYDQPKWYLDMITRFTRDDIPVRSLNVMSEIIKVLYMKTFGDSFQ